MKQKILSVIVTTLLMLIISQAKAQTHASEKGQPLIWHTDMVKASELSKLTNKPLFAFFTGSDWCPWCKKLQRDVFSKPAFIKWAESHVVLVELDFPRNKAQEPSLIQQNKSLQEAFNVQGYPTVWMFYLHKNEDGESYAIESLGSLGSPQGAESGKEELKFLKDADAFLENKKAK